VENETKTRILLVEDHISVRQALAFFFEQEPDFEVAAQAGSLAELAGLEHDYDVAIVDVGLPDGDGIDAVRDLRRNNPGGMVLVLSGSLDRTQFARAVEAGATGALHKNAMLDEIVDTVKRLRDGESLLSMNEVVDLLRLAGDEREKHYRARNAADQLTRREREVLQALADGLSDREISGRLTITLETVRTHMGSILKKLGADSRLQALLFAVRHGIIELS
jgi:DNA-binding NarL/FixJ family response regulator